MKASEEKESPLYPDYWFVETPTICYTVSPVMADSLRRQLNRWPRVRWVSLVDIAGARLLLRSSVIMSVEQSSPETRAMWRRINKERKQENPEANLGL